MHAKSHHTCNKTKHAGYVLTWVFTIKVELSLHFFLLLDETSTKKNVYDFYIFRQKRSHLLFSGNDF